MPQPPTAKQLAALRALARRTGMPAGTHATVRSASRRITQLSSVGSLTSFERRLIAGAHDHRPQATTVRDDEIEGYGAEARFRGQR